jgi:hypothetical protein
MKCMRSKGMDGAPLRLKPHSLLNWSFYAITDDSNSLGLLISSNSTKKKEEGL